MNHRRFNIGPGAASLILIIVVLSMSVLGVLTLMNARSDISLSERSLAVAEETYELNQRAEQAFAALDAIAVAAAKDSADQTAYLAAIEKALPEGMALKEDIVAWTEHGKSGRSLSCAVRIAALGESPRLTWAAHQMTVNSEALGMEELWN